MLTLGARRMAASAMRTLVASALPGAEVESLESALVERARVLNQLAHTGPQAAIVGVPGPGRAPRTMPLVELLATSDIAQWALLVLARPLPRRELYLRHEQISALRQRVANDVSVAVDVTATTHRTEHDVRLAVLADLLQREEDRTLAAARQTGFNTEAWLLAADGDALAALSAIAAARVAAPGTRPHPAEVVAFAPTGGRAETLLLDADLAALIQPPVHDVPGLAVRGWARFDEEPERVERGGAMIQLGQTPAGVPVRYPADALTAHVLVSGLTGSGKSVFVRALRAAADVPSLVIEPTKSDFAGSAPTGSLVWRVGDPADTSGLALNPLEVPSGVPVQTHIDMVMALFESSFTLFSPLPHVLEQGLRRCYTDRGWDLAASRNAFLDAEPGYPVHPTLVDLLQACREVVDTMGYHGEVRDNVDAALRARLGSLVAGAKARALQTQERFPIDRVLEADAVINFESVGNDEEKAFFIGLVLIRLLAARRGQVSAHLRHLTVLEEAHRVLKRDTGADADGRGGPSFASEMFGNLMAEIRSAGEALVVVDQSPRKLTDDALANTALQIAFRTTLGADKEALASSMNLDEAQTRALTGLKTHRAIVFWEGMDRPVALDTQYAFGTAAARFAAARTPVRPAVTLDDPHLRALAEAAVRSLPEERAAVVEQLRERARELLPANVRGLAETAVDDALAAVVEALRLRRRWPDQVALEGVRPALLDGRRPYVGCRHVCPTGGCLVGDALAPAAARLRTEGAAQEWARGDLSGAVRVAAVNAFAGAAAPSVLEIAGPCLAVQVLDGAGETFLAERVRAVGGG